MSNTRRKELEGTGRRTAGKTAVLGMKDRATKQVVAKVIDRTDQPTLQGFVRIPQRRRMSQHSRRLHVG